MKGDVGEAGPAADAISFAANDGGGTMSLRLGAAPTTVTSAAFAAFPASGSKISRNGAEIGRPLLLRHRFAPTSRLSEGP
jgi:hypothetical protein